MYEPNHRRSTYDGFLTKRYEPLALKADAEQGIASGYSSLFWVVDSYAEATAPGSFAKSIADRGPTGADRILVRYEHEKTVGRHLSMVEDVRGLYIEALISDDGMYGSMLRRQLADGVPYGWSIGFRRQGDRTATDADPLDFSSAPEWVKSLPRNEIRILTETKMMENSAVSFPANDPAVISSYRSEAEDFAALLDALKSRKLTPDELTQLKAFIDAQPADTGAGGGETPPTTPSQTAQRRNYLAEFELLTGVKL